MKRLLLLIVVLFSGVVVASAQNRIDVIRPDAPELAAHGDFDIGVRTLEFVNPDQIDVLNTEAGGENAIYDRPLTVEVWYPADVAEGTEPTPYTVGTRDVEIDATLIGRAVRDAEPDASAGPYPLVIISHGYPGNRFLMSHLGENLATKGYVTVSIDHTDSTYPDQAAFGSTLLNRSLDQLFVLDTVAALNEDSESFLAGMVDAANTGIIGYSMGGYGAVNVIGGGYTEASVDFGFSPPNGLLALRQSGTEEYEATFDDRVKAVIAIAPWGMNAGFWNEETLAGIETPVMFMGGSIDDVSGYENGFRAIYEGAVNADRYLLTFENGNHNTAAPMPVPQEVLDAGSESYTHYLDPVWDNVRMNNIAQHFATAYFGWYLKGDEELGSYLDVAVENAQDGVYAVDDDGNFTEEHTYWPGFEARSAVGLMLEHALPAGE